jgi:hypothetical protein
MLQLPSVSFIKALHVSHGLLLLLPCKRIYIVKRVVIATETTTTAFQKMYRGMELRNISIVNSHYHN